MTTFIAVDVETANADLASICQIGLVAFEEGQIAGRVSVLVNPQDHFDPVNVSIHGITEEAVRGALTFEVAFPPIARRLRHAVEMRVMRDHSVGFALR